MSNLDFKGMIEANYNVLSNLEASIQGFFRKFEDIDTKIVEKETAFINAKQEFKELIKDYKSTLDQVREDFNLAISKEHQNFIEVANTNTEKILKAKEEELKEKLELEENNILLKTKDLLETMENFQNNINSKIVDTIKNLPEALEEEKDLIINKTLENIKETSKTLQSSIEDYRKILEQELESYKNSLIEEVRECKYSLIENIEDIKEVAENIKKENISLNKNRSNLETDYQRVNNSLEVANRNTTNLINSISNVNYAFIINKIYILLFALLNSLFILRIIVPKEYRVNFKSNFTLWIIIIIVTILVFLAIGDTFNHFANLWINSGEDEARED